MWEDDICWNKVNFMLDGGCTSDSDGLLSPRQDDPISPLSSMGMGSPYSGGSMSPDTTSVISIPSTEGGMSLWGGSDTEGDCFSPADLFSPKGIFFGSPTSAASLGLSPIPTRNNSGTKKSLPSMFEWRTLDVYQSYFQHQAPQLAQNQSQPMKFIFPALASGNEKGCPAHPQNPHNSGHTNDSVVTSSTSPAKFRKDTKPLLSSTNKSSLLTIGQRETKFLKSFKTPSTQGSTSTADVISSTCSPHGTIKPFHCMWIDCRGSFLQKDSLIDHIDRSHIQTRREDFSCFWHGCVRRNRPFNARYKLLIHMRVHTGHKPNKCTVVGCDKAFSRLENLKIHLRSHTGERPYICPHCPKAFSNSSDRAKHQRTHFDSKPYACTFENCEKRYTDPSSLRKHAKMHYFVGGKGAVSKCSGVSGVGKKEGQQGKRNRRKYLGGEGVVGKVAGGMVDVKPVPIAQTAQLPVASVFTEKRELLKSNTDIHIFLNGNGDPSLNQFVSSTSPILEEPVVLPLPQLSPSITVIPPTLQNDLKVEETEAINFGVSSGTDYLYTIPYDDLVCSSGVNFDDTLYSDYIL